MEQQNSPSDPNSFRETRWIQLMKRTGPDLDKDANLLKILFAV